MFISLKWKIFKGLQILRSPLVDGTSKPKFKDTVSVCMLIMYFETWGGMYLYEYFKVKINKIISKIKETN